MENLRLFREIASLNSRKTFNNLSILLPLVRREAFEASDFPPEVMSAELAAREQELREQKAHRCAV